MIIDHNELAQYCVTSYHKKTGSAKDVEFLHIRNDRAHVFAFRGTEADKFFSGRGWKDVIRDLAVWPRDIGNTEGHAGFVSGWQAIAPKVKSIIRTEPDKPIVLTGHSLGGSIALIGAYRLIKAGLNVELVTFGAPRALVLSGIDSKVLLDLRAASTQYQHYRDWFPGLMNWTDYDHVDDSFLGAKNRAIWPRRRKRVHAMTKYQRYLEKA